MVRFDNHESSFALGWQQRLQRLNGATVYHLLDKLGLRLYTRYCLRLQRDGPWLPVVRRDRRNARNADAMADGCDAAADARADA